MLNIRLCIIFNDILMKLLFVCLGNICRSPMAEGIMRKLVEERGLEWEIDSAGTNGYHTGEAPHQFSQKVCKEKGIDISSQSARRFSVKDFDRFDHIFVLAKDVLIDVAALARNAEDLKKVAMITHFLPEGKDEDVVDPWYGGLEGYYPVLRHIEECCAQLVPALRSKS